MYFFIFSPQITKFPGKQLPVLSVFSRPGISPVKIGQNLSKSHRLIPFLDFPLNDPLYWRKISHQKISCFELLSIHPRHFQSWVPQGLPPSPRESQTQSRINLTQHIGNNSEEGIVTVVLFAYLYNILEITKDIYLTELTEGMLENRLFFVELGNQNSRWRGLKNGLLHGSVLAPLFLNVYTTPLLFNIYTNDQPKTEGTYNSTCCFIYADDLGVSAQHNWQVEQKPGGRGREWATIGVHPLSWLLSNNRLEKVPFVSVPHTSSNRLLLSNQDKGCTPSVAHSLTLPLGPALLNLWNNFRLLRMHFPKLWIN